MDRNQAILTLQGPSPQEYMDTADPGTPPVGPIEIDPGEPATPITAAHIALITEELRNVVLAAGLTPAPDNDTQIREALGVIAGGERWQFAQPGFERTLSGSAWLMENTGGVYVSTVGAQGAQWIVPFSVPVGMTIYAFGAAGQDNGTGANKPDIELVEVGYGLENVIDSIDDAFDGAEELTQTLATPHLHDGVNNLIMAIKIHVPSTWDGTYCSFRKAYMEIGRAAPP